MTFMTRGLYICNHATLCSACALCAVVRARYRRFRTCTITGGVQAPLPSHSLNAFKRLYMPTYVYRREDGTKFEIKQRITDDPLKECPETGQPVERIIAGSAGLIFKGDGFYINDYARNATGPEASSDSTDTAGSASSTSDSSASASTASESNGDTSTPSDESSGKGSAESARSSSDT